MNKKINLLFLLPLVVTSCSKSKSSIPDGYKLFFEDSFDGDTLNSDYWSPMIGDGSPNTGWGNNELEYYKAENATVSDGYLHITAQRETVGNYNFTSARIRTTQKVFFTYGIIEARIKLPEAKGLWPAFWMLPEEFAYGGWPDSGEIDIMEANCGYIYGTSCALHYSVNAGVDAYESGYNQMKTRDSEDYISNWHVYKVDWQEDVFTFYVDDREIMSVPMRVWGSGTVDKTSNPYAPFDKDFHILLNMAVGGNYVGNVAPEASFTSAEMLVDYVRVYTYSD